MDILDIREGINSLLEGVQVLINKTVDKAPFDKTFRGYISEVNSSDTPNTYTVIIENMKYPNTPVLNSTTKLSLGETVLVLFPRNNSNSRVILR